MANEYKNAETLLKPDEKIPFEKRIFMLLLLSSTLAAFDAAHADVGAVLKPDTNQDAGRFALRTQVIRDPTHAIGNRDQLLQFFLVNPNHDKLLRGGQPGVIYEVTPGAEGGEKPLVYLTAAEVALVVHGEGFSTPMYR